MNILVLSNCPTVESQGSGYVIINTAKCLLDLGHTVDIISPTNLMFIPSWTGRARNYRMIIGMAKWVYTNRRKLPNYELIIIYGAEGALALFILKTVFKLKIPIVLHSNGLEVHEIYHMKDTLKSKKELSWYHFDQSWIFNYCYSKIDAIINVSNFERNFAIQQIKLNPAKIHVLEPCLPDIFFNFNSDTNLPKKPIITFCGTWVSRKGVQVIEEVIPAILRKYSKYTFRIIGTGNEFKLPEHFPEDIINKIELFPFIESKKRMIELYSESSIFLFPSIHESFGLVIAEAMHCSCAVICGHTGFAAEIKNYEEALVLESPGAEQVYNALEQLIVDVGLREKLAFNGKKRTEQLKWINYKDHLQSTLNIILTNYHLN